MSPSLSDWLPVHHPAWFNVDVAAERGGRSTLRDVVRPHIPRQDDGERRTPRGRPSRDCGRSATWPSSRRATSHPWRWTAMIMQPDHITTNHVAAATVELRRMKDPPALDRIGMSHIGKGSRFRTCTLGPTPTTLQPSPSCTNSPPTAATNSAASTLNLSQRSAAHGTREARNSNKPAGRGTSRRVARRREAAVLLCGPASVDDEHVTRDHGSRWRR
jgi:hypothetical protein